MKKKLIYILLLIILVGAISGFLVWKYYINRPSKTYENEPAAYKLSASELFHDFQNDKTKADAKYLGKVIQISGILKNVEQIDTIVKVVFAFSQGLFGDEGIRCTILQKDAAKAKKLGENYPITLKGYCTGFNDTDVILEKCIIVE